MAHINEIKSTPVTSVLKKEDNIELWFNGMPILVTGTMYDFQEVMKQVQEKLGLYWSLERQEWQQQRNRTQH